MAQSELLSRTVEKIYAAVADAGRWREALTAIEDFTGSTGAVIDLVPRSSASIPQTMSGSFSRDDCAHYATTYQSICRRIAFVRANPDIRTHVDSLILSEAEMDRDPVYDWLGKHGLRYFVAGPCGTTQQHFAYFSLQRSRGQGHAQDSDVALFDLIRPHLVQAIALADSLNTLAAHRRFSDAMLDALPQAVFGLDAAGVLLFVNASGERMLARGDCLRSTVGRLITPVAAQQPRLDALIADVLDGGSGGTLSVQRTGGGPPCAVRVSPIHGDDIERHGHPAALVIATDPVGAVTVDEAALQALHGLTPAEARAAVTLLDGHSIHSAAQRLGIAAETMRSHLKSIFRKMGVSRQQDLVRRLIELEQVASKSASPK